MLIEKKLALSNNSTEIIFIREGIFLRSYNQRAYILMQHLNHSFKLTVKNIKKLNNQAIIYIGFPESMIYRKFPDIIETEWGFKLIGNWDLANYPEWMAEQTAQAECTASADLSALADNTATADSAVNKTSKKSGEVLASPLTPQLLAFLSAWQPNKYPSAVDSGFIAALKAELIF